MKIQFLVLTIVAQFVVNTDTFRSKRPSSSISSSKGNSEQEGSSTSNIQPSSVSNFRSQITSRYSYWESFGEFDGSVCSLDKKLKKEIKSYQDFVDIIMNSVINGKFKGDTFKHLSHFTDHFGSRIVTSNSYKKAVSFLTRQFLNIPTLSGRVFVEDVLIPNWKRGKEYAEILQPIARKIAVKGMGLTVPTKGPLDGEVIVINTLEELRLSKFSILAKILVLNLNFQETQLIFQTAASRGALLGAIAVLVKSPAPFSLYSLHATLLQYSDRTRRIPAATITLEDAELLSRLYKKGKKVIVRLSLENSDTSSQVVTQNILGDFDGREKVDEFVLATGYADSWDIGQGAVDGLSTILIYELARVFDDLKLYPRRTVRTALWTASKFGSLGALRYIENHENELAKKYAAVLSANLGCLAAKGFIYSGTTESACIIYEILRLFTPNVLGGSINPTTIQPFLSLIHINGTVSDSSYFSKPTVGIGSSPSNVPSLTLNGDDGHLYWFADSQGDTVSMFESDKLDVCLGIYTTMTYILADLTDILPR